MTSISVETWDADDRWGYRYTVETVDGILAAESGTLSKILVASEADARAAALDRAQSFTTPAPTPTVVEYVEQNGEWVVSNG